MREFIAGIARRKPYLLPIVLVMALLPRHRETDRPRRLKPGWMGC